MEDVIVEPALPNWVGIFVSLADPPTGGDLDAHRDVWDGRSVQLRQDSVPMIGQVRLSRLPLLNNSRRRQKGALLRGLGLHVMKNRECSSTHLNPDIGERPQVPANPAFPLRYGCWRDTAGNLTPPVPPHRRSPSRSRARSVAQGHDALAGTCGFLLRSRRAGSVPDRHGQFQSTCPIRVSAVIFSIGVHRR